MFPGKIIHLLSSRKLLNLHVEIDVFGPVSMVEWVLVEEILIEGFKH